jgi:CheY-like chemotaxis protein
MANVLITDLFEESAYLVRSLLRGAGHAVSIAISRGDAEAKLSTGLFDVLVLDYGVVVDDNLAVGRFANEVLPGLPVVALTREGSEELLGELQLSGRFERPIRGRVVTETINEALAGMFRRSSRRAVPRVPVNLPIELELAGMNIRARAVDLSSRGVAVDATEIKLSTQQLEALESHVGQRAATAALTIAEGRVIRLSAKLAFFERHRSLAGRTIGLAFENLDEQSEVALNSLYAKAA